MVSRPSFNIFPACSSRCMFFCLFATPLAMRAAAAGLDEIKVEFGRVVQSPSRIRKQIENITWHDDDELSFFDFSPRTQRDTLLQYDESNDFLLEEFLSLSLSYSYDYNKKQSCDENGTCSENGNTYKPVPGTNCHQFTQETEPLEPKVHTCPPGLQFDVQECVCNWPGKTDISPKTPPSKSPTTPPASSPTSRNDSNDEDNTDLARISTDNESPAVDSLASVSSSQAGKTPVLVFSCNEEGEIRVEENTPDAKNFADITSVTITFTYSADTSRNDTSFVASLDRAVLFTAVSAALGCGSPPSGRQLSDSKAKEDRALMALKSLSDNSSTASHAAGSCEPTAPSAQFCFLMQRRLTFLLSGVSDPEHAETRALSNIETAMGDGRYVTGHIPSLKSVRFFGSQPGSFEKETHSSEVSPATGASPEGAQNDTFSLLAKGALAFISVGGIILALFFVHKRRNRRSVQHVELKDDNISTLTLEGYGEIV